MSRSKQKPQCPPIDELTENQIERIAAGHFSLTSVRERLATAMAKPVEYFRDWSPKMLRSAVRDCIAQGKRQLQEHDLQVIAELEAQFAKSS